MGKASRRKRERANPAPATANVGRPAARRTRTRRQQLLIAVVVAGVVALSLGGWLLDREPEPGPASIPGPIAALPDPDISGMTAPVARVIREARQAALARPESAMAVGRLGQVLHAHWLLDEASTCYGIAHQISPEEFRWAYLLAGVEDIRGADPQRIDLLFRESIRLAPRFPPVYVRYSDALLRFGRWPEARDSYAAAIQLDPGLVLAHRGLGQAASLLGDGPAAVEHLERAAALSPEDRIVQISLARAYTLVGRSDQAAEATRKAQAMNATASLPDPVFFEVENLAVDPETLRKRFARGLREGDYETAIEAATLLEESGAPAAVQQLAQASKQRANQLAMAGEFDRALAEYERATGLATGDPEIEHNWGTVLLRRGDLDEAGRHFERAIVLNPQSADSLYNLGVVLEGLERGDEAIERFKRAAEINPQHMAAQRLVELGVVSNSQTK